VDTRTASAQKKDLRRAMLAGPIAHLSEVGRLAAKENAELGKSFLVKPGWADTCSSRIPPEPCRHGRDAQGAIGEVRSVGVGAGAARPAAGSVRRGGHARNRRRTARKALRGKLRSVSTQIAQTVRVMDARNRQRFEDDPQALWSWLSAKQVLGSPKGSGAPAPAEGGPPPQRSGVAFAVETACKRQDGGHARTGRAHSYSFARSDASAAFSASSLRPATSASTMSIFAFCCHRRIMAATRPIRVTPPVAVESASTRAGSFR
jgi:hypothetical protein